MQLKRDTEYALRILMCVAGQKDGGITVLEISKHTAVPASITARLCQKMTDAGLMKSVSISKKSTGYLISEDALNKTLYDVISVVEGHSELFAVFDRTTEMFSAGLQYFEGTEEKFTDLLKQLTLQKLKDGFWKKNDEVQRKHGLGERD